MFCTVVVGLYTILRTVFVCESSLYNTSYVQHIESNRETEHNSRLFCLPAQMVYGTHDVSRLNHSTKFQPFQNVACRSF